MVALSIVRSNLNQREAVVSKMSSFTDMLANWLDHPFPKIPFPIVLYLRNEGNYLCCFSQIHSFPRQMCLTPSLARKGKDNEIAGVKWTFLVSLVGVPQA